MTQNVSWCTQTCFRIQREEESIRVPEDYAILACGGACIDMDTLVHRNDLVSVLMIYFSISGVCTILCPQFVPGNKE
jgi:hypothetical protein